MVLAKQGLNKNIIFAVIIASFFVTTLIAFADWTPPLNPPPTCIAGNPGCDTPVNVGSTAQFKLGGLTVAQGVGVNPGFLVLNGNVGIGTAAPAEKLAVAGDVSIANTSGVVGTRLIVIDDPTNTNEGDVPTIELRADGGINVGKLGINGNDGQYYTNAVANATYFGSVTAHPTQIVQNRIARMTIVDPSGFTGIGATNPGFILDVAGRMRIRQGGGTAGIWFYDTDPPATDKAFVGMASDQSVGFYGNMGTPGWRFTVDTANGDASVARNLLIDGNKYFDGNDDSYVRLKDTSDSGGFLDFAARTIWADNKLCLSGSCITRWPDLAGIIGGGGGIGGGGTPTRIPQFTGPTTIGDSIMYQTGSTIVAEGDINASGNVNVGSQLFANGQRAMLWGGSYVQSQSGNTCIFPNPLVGMTTGAMPASCQCPPGFLAFGMGNFMNPTDTSSYRSLLGCYR